MGKSIQYIILVFICTSISSVAAQKALAQTYTNPIIKFDRGMADVTIWGDSSDYYLLSTGSFEKSTICKSGDLVTWVDTYKKIIDNETQEDIKQLLEDVGLSSNGMFWAPHVIRIQDKWNLYLSLENKGGIIVLQSESPTGPFHFVGEPKILISNQMMGWDYDAIDPFVVKDKGKVWIFFGSAFGIYRGRLTSDGLSLHKDNGFVHVAGPTSPKQLVDGKVHGGHEGVYLYKHNRFWYCIVSKRLDYSLYVGRSKKITGEFLDDKGRKLTEGYGTRMNYPTPGFESPGHNGEIFKDNEGRYYIFYHAKTKNISGNPYGLRQVVLSELEWIDGFPYIKDRIVQRQGNIAPRLK